VPSRKRKKGHDRPTASVRGRARLIDNIAIRVSLNTAAFAVWLAVAVGLLQLAVKI
jgi:hypothetical protein